MTDNELDRIFAAYREALPGPEPSAHFTPRLWAAIEGRRTYRARFGRLSRAFVTAAGAVWLTMVTALIIHSASTSPFAGVDLVADSRPELVNLNSPGH